MFGIKTSTDTSVSRYDELKDAVYKILDSGTDVFYKYFKVADKERIASGKTAFRRFESDNVVEDFINEGASDTLFDVGEIFDAGDTFEYDESNNAAGKVIFNKRYQDIKDSDYGRLYKSAKDGNVIEAAYFAGHNVTKEAVDTLKELGNDVIIIPVIGENGNNKTPESLARALRSKSGNVNEIFDGVYKLSNSFRSQSLSVWERMKKPYPDFALNNNYADYDFSGKKFFLVDDNSTSGRTFKGLTDYIGQRGGNVVGYYAATVGQDQSEKMFVSSTTWREIESEGLENVAEFARQNGVLRSITRYGLTENEAGTLLDEYRSSRRSNSGVRKSAQMGTGVREVHNGTPGSSGLERGRLSTDSGAFSLPDKGTRYYTDISFDSVTPIEETRYADPMYYKSERVITALNQSKFDAGSLMKMLQGKGVKPDELKWLGLEQWLSDKKSVSKGELLRFIQDNRLNMTETTERRNDTDKSFNSEEHPADSYAILSGSVAVTRSSR